MARFLIVTALLGLSVTFVSGATECYICKSPEGDGPDHCRVLNPADASVTKATCAGSCQKVSTSALKVERRCEANAVANGCNPPVGTPGYPRTCSCRTELCNEEPMLVEQPTPLSCYKCGTTDQCKAAPFYPGDTDIVAKTCAPGQVCLTTRKEDVDGKVISVSRGCSTADDTPSDRCHYEPISGGVYESKCYCKKTLCNFLTTNAKEPIKCLKCDSNEPGSLCKAVPEDHTGDGITVVECGPNIPCQTIRSTLPENKERVVRGCAEKPSENKCEYFSLLGGLKETKCYYNEELVNDIPIELFAPINCYECGKDQNQNACRAEPVPTTTPTIQCPSNVGCLTTRTKQPNGVADLVTRGCNTEAPASPHHLECSYSAGAVAESKCPCLGEKCNNILPSLAKPPLSCYECDKSAACAKHPFLETGITVGTCRDNMPCITTRWEKPGTAPTVARGCGTTVTADSCTYGALQPDGTRTSTCYCNKDKCNKETTPIVNPETPLAPAQQPFLSCHTCKDTVACRTDPFGQMTGPTVENCLPNVPCVTIRTEKDGETSVERRCGARDEENKKDCDYSTPNGGKQSTCYCNSNKCNNEKTSVDVQPGKDGPFISCYTCNVGDVGCAVYPFSATGAGVSVKHCNTGIPCVTIRREKNGAATVERRCADNASKVDTCDFTTPEGARESHCYCNSDKCNNKLTSTRRAGDSGAAVTVPAFLTMSLILTLTKLFL